jgi:hypothetical protein
VRQCGRSTGRRTANFVCPAVCLVAVVPEVCGSVGATAAIVLNYEVCGGVGLRRLC